MTSVGSTGPRGTDTLLPLSGGVVGFSHMYDAFQSVYLERY